MAGSGTLPLYGHSASAGMQRIGEGAANYRIFEINLFVRSFVGLSKKCCGGPSSMMRPSSIMTMRSAASRAKPIS